MSAAVNYLPKIITFAVYIVVVLFHAPPHIMNLRAGCRFQLLCARVCTPFSRNRHTEARVPHTNIWKFTVTLVYLFVCLLHIYYFVIYFGFLWFTTSKKAAKKCVAKIYRRFCGRSSPPSLAAYPAIIALLLAACFRPLQRSLLPISCTMCQNNLTA